MSPVYDFGQGLGCGLSIRHCHSVTESCGLSCFLALLPRSIVLVRCLREANLAIFFARGLVGVDKHLCQMVSLVITSMTLPLNLIFVLLLANVDVIPKKKN